MLEFSEPVFPGFAEGGDLERMVDFGLDPGLFAGMRDVAVQLRSTNDLPCARSCWRVLDARVPGVSVFSVLTTGKTCSFASITLRSQMVNGVGIKVS